MRLGLSAGAPPKSGPGFQFASGAGGSIVAFDRPSAAARLAATSSAMSATQSSLAASARGAAPAGHHAKAGTEPFEPPRAQLAGLKLTFRGFFLEAVPESPIESSRKRTLVLQYHLVDDMTEVLEPEVRNDGLAHGKFLKKMPLPQVTLETLRVGADIEICGRVIHITACDDFSRNYFAGIGVSQPENEGEEKDAWGKTQELLAHRNDPEAFHGVKSSAITRFIEAVNGSSRASSFKKDMKGRFLEFGSDKLNFLVTWDSSRHKVRAPSCPSRCAPVSPFFLFPLRVRRSPRTQPQISNLRPLLLLLRSTLSRHTGRHARRGAEVLADVPPCDRDGRHQGRQG